MTRPDIRNERTKQAIKDALLSRMATKPFSDIGVSEIAREASISRSTFYAHYDNLSQVYNELIVDMGLRVRTLTAQLRCDACTSDNGANATRPFCETVRSAGKYEPLVHDPLFLETISNVSAFVHDNDLSSLLEEAGVPSDLACAIIKFQQNGCFAVATTTPPDVDWDSRREALDTFIRGGIAAVRARYAPRA